MKKTTTNATKTNDNYNELFDILSTTICNKNALTLKLNSCGYIANMRSKNANDYTTINNDLYYQLTDGSRLFFGTNRKMVQLWLTDTLFEMRDKIIPNSDKLFYSACTDSIRTHKTDKKIEFSLEWFNQFITNYNKYFKVRFTDIIETK